MPQFYPTGKIEPSNTGHSFKVYLLDNEKWVFIGLVTPKALSSLLQRKIRQADICKFSQPEQEPLNFSVELKS